MNKLQENELKTMLLEETVWMERMDAPFRDLYFKKLKHKAIATLENVETSVDRQSYLLHQFSQAQTAEELAGAL
jgi:hypothetical protein